MEIIVGTAGHIDHGKTALIKALTGVDADRLPEEKDRGITIDIGFAERRIEDVRFGFVDVPGHERFIKNMLAGVSGIDLVLLVVAADEGVMPQTREHFEICRLLGVSCGLVVLSKLDLVDEETLELARLDVAELVSGSFLENAPVISVSSRSGVGLESLNAAILNMARNVTRSPDVHVVRLPIDRSFTVKGFGTVVTGTLVSGEIASSDELEIVPGERKVRVRGMQTYGETTQKATRGQRVAVNLAGLDRDEVERGMTLTEAGVLLPTQIVDANVEVLGSSARSLRSRQRVRIHIGTAEVLARVSVLNHDGFISSGSTDFVQLRFEAPVIALPGDRFIIRAYSPQSTIAGGFILDNLAEKHRKRDLPQTRERLANLAMIGDDYSNQIVNYLDKAGEKGLSFSELQACSGIRSQFLRGILNTNVEDDVIVDCGEHFVSRVAFNGLSERLVAAISGFHRREPLGKGLSIESIRENVFARTVPSIGQAVVAELTRKGTIVIDKEVARLASHRNELSADEAAAATKLRSIYTTAGCEVPRLDDALVEAAGSRLDRQQTRSVFQLLVNAGELIKVTDEFYFSRDTLATLTEKLRHQAAASGGPTIDVAKFKEIAGVSRKYAIPLLEYFDHARVTVRAGDKRIVL